MAPLLRAALPAELRWAPRGPDPEADEQRGEPAAADSKMNAHVLEAVPVAIPPPPVDVRGSHVHLGEELPPPPPPPPPVDAAKRPDRF